MVLGYRETENKESSTHWCLGGVGGPSVFDVLMFPGCTVLCMADLTVTQIKRFYVLLAHSQS